MRNVVVSGLLAAFACLANPVEAAVLTTTATGCNGADCPSLPVQLQSFDPSLGMLQSVVVSVDVDAITAYAIGFQSWAGDPFQTTGSAHLAYTGPFQFALNGQNYTLQIAGTQDVNFTIADLASPGGEFHARGSTSFNVGSNLLDSFLSGTTNCGNFVCALGLTSAPGIGSIVQSAENVSFTPFQSAVLTRYTLTYVYSPVPEPATWAMIIFGLAGIGMVARRKRYAGAPPLVTSRALL